MSAAGQRADEAQIALSSDGTKGAAAWVSDNGTNNIIQAAPAIIRAWQAFDTGLPWVWSAF